MPGTEIPFDADTEPLVGFSKLQEGGVYPAQIVDYEEGVWKSGQDYVGWVIEINTEGDHWRKLPRNAYQTQTTDRVGNLRSLLHATNVLPVAKQREMGKAYVNYDDLIGPLFQVKITYYNMDKPPKLTEYPRIRSVFSVRVAKEEVGPGLTDLPF